MMRSVLLVPVALVSAWAGAVTADTYATVGTGKTLVIDFSVWNYGVNNPGSDPYPTHVGLSVIGPPPGIAAQTLPDSSVSSFPGYLFEGSLAATDGSVFLPFTGPFLAAPGQWSAGGDPFDIAVITGAIDLTPAQSRDIFGQSFTARFILQNMGAPFTVGLGPGYTVRNSIFVTDVAGAGPRTVGGLTGEVTVHNPEPATWLLIAAALTALAGLGRKTKR